MRLLRLFSAIVDAVTGDRATRARRIAAASGLAAWWGVTSPVALLAQATPRPFLDWHTVTTKYFVVHYPSEFAEWADSLVPRLDAEHDAVSRMVGNAPTERVTVMVEDPLSTSNGFALPFLDTPLIFLFPTPPEPWDEIGNSRTWPEILSVHEYAHIAHLTTPSRDPDERRLWRLLPVSFSPIAARSPRWVIEGYATYVEGRITGSGRPHGVWRAAVLRRWALEGQMPRYSQLDGGAEYEGGAMAYLAGSAFLEWLVARGGDSSLVHVWRRMTARDHRTFDVAFAGVFGDAPAVLYGRFVAELTGKALAIEHELGTPSTSAAASTIVQHLAWSTGDPALSRDGRLIAIELVSRAQPSRVVIWAARDSVDTAAVTRARKRARSRDSLDVPAIQAYPRAKRAIATLRHASGRPFRDPRFFPDGRNVLLVRDVALGDGSVAPDLFIWNWPTGALRRVTHGASVRSADPSPDGRFAVGDRCTGGRCDLVRIDLTTGALQLVAGGSVGGSYSRPRIARDGRSVVAALQTHGRWRLAMVDLRCAPRCAPRFVDPDDGASRYEPSFTPNGRALIAVSEVGGIPNLERIDLDGGATRTLTRVSGAVLAPAPNARDASVYFLALHARGWDLDRIVPDSVSVSTPVALDARLAPAAPLPVVAADTFAVGAVSPPRRYGIGPRLWRMLPSGTYATDGSFVGFAIADNDPVGRLGIIAQGVLGSASTWRGAALSAVWRGWAPSVQGDAFYTRELPSLQRALPIATRALDVEYAGGDAIIELDRRYEAHSYVVRIGASAGSLRGPVIARSDRILGVAELGGTLRQTIAGNALSESLAMHVDGGRSEDVDWTRGVATASLSAYSPMVALGARVDGTLGQVSNGAPVFEQFAVGGVRAPLIDGALLAQRIAMAALPVGIASGRQVAMYRAALTGLIFEPFVWGASAGDDLDRWHRLIGAQSDVLVGALPYVGLPAVRIVGGVAYSLDDPFRHKTRGYLSVSLRP